MKLYLFGWAEITSNDVPAELKLIEQVIKETGVKQVLHIPFARTIATEEERSGDRFHRYIHLEWVEYLNAENPDDLAKVDSPLILISGGSESLNLVKKIQASEQLLSLITHAKYIIGESAWAKSLAQYARVLDENKNRLLIPGLNLLKDTIIEPHYTQQNRQQILEDEMQETWMKYGIGIDCITAMVFNLDEFPLKYEKIGDGNIEIKINND